MSKFALAIVVDAENADKAWEEMGQVAGGTYDEFDMAFLGDTFPIAEQETYDSGQAAQAILAGVSQLRNGLPVPGEKNGWLIEWDGGWATRDSEREAWIRVGELCADSEDSGYKVADFKVSRNMPPPELEAGAMSTSDGLGADVVDPAMLKAATPADAIAKWKAGYEALRGLQVWLVDPATDGEDAGDAIGRTLVAAGLTRS